MALPVVFARRTRLFESDDDDLSKEAELLVPTQSTTYHLTGEFRLCRIVYVVVAVTEIVVSMAVTPSRTLASTSARRE